MADVTSLPAWTGRAATRALGENLVAIQVYFDGSKLANVPLTTEFIGLCEIPFGATVLDAMFRATTLAGGAATGKLGVVGFTSYLDGAFTANASTGNDVDGLMVAVDMNSAVSQPIRQTAVAGALLGAKLDASIFSDADELGKPLYIAYQCNDVTTALTAVRGYFTFLVLCP